MRPIYNIGEVKTSKQPARNPTNNDEEEESNGKWYLKSVRNLINVFEQKNKSNLSKVKSKSYVNLRQNNCRTKDVVNRFETRKQKSIPELDTIKNTANSLKSKISESKNIDSKECIVYQNQIIALLTKIGSLESNGNPLIKEEKQKCLKIVQGCNIALKTKTGEQQQPVMALGNFVRSLTQYDSNHNEQVSKVQFLRGIFEAKNDGNIKQEAAVKKPLVIDDEFTYTPYSEYLKRKNTEEKINLSSKSCENIATHDYSGIKRLLNRLNDKKKGNTHYRAKSLSDIKLEDQSFSIKTSMVASSNGNIEEDEISAEAEPEVKLVSVKQAEDAEIPVIVVPEETDLNGDDDSDDEDSDEGEEHKHSSGFYSFVGDESFDDNFQDAEEEKEVVSEENGYYEPFNHVKCKMANGIVNITLNGVQVE